MSEIWKDIPGYKGLYQASTQGRIRSTDTRKVIVSRNQYGAYKYTQVFKGKILSPDRNEYNGYSYVTLYKNGLRSIYSVHKLILNTFKPNAKHLPAINHKNEVRSDNRLCNLEYCTYKYNNNYGHHAIRQSLAMSTPLILTMGNCIHYCMCRLEAEKYIKKHTHTMAKLYSIGQDINKIKYHSNINTVYGYHVIFCKKITRL